jgi:hypothetical protein
MYGWVGVSISMGVETRSASAAWAVMFAWFILAVTGMAGALAISIRKWG